MCLLFVLFILYLFIQRPSSVSICGLSLSVGNDVSLSQQLDQCNNNVPDGDTVVLPSAPRSKTSSNSSSPSPSLRSSPSSSPLSPSTSSSSSDAVSLLVTNLQTFGRISLKLPRITFVGEIGFDIGCFVFASGLRRHAVQNSQAAGWSGRQHPQRKVCHCQ